MHLELAAHVDDRVRVGRFQDVPVLLDDGSIRLIQILYRNDREEDCSTAELIAWDKAIIEEDRDILESTDPDAIVDMSRKLEMHMPSDRPGMLMRKRLNALLEAHGEREVPR